MKILSEKEFNGLNIKAMFTEKVEQAKKELSPLIQEVRKYIPQAGYGYHVVSGEYLALHDARIEFTYNGTRFHVYRINKEDKYRVATDMEHFEYVNRYDTERAGSQYEKPCNIGVLTAKKINDRIDYYIQIYRQVEQANAENARKVVDFLKNIENEPVSWERRNYVKGTITRNGLRFTFYIEKGHLSFELSLSYRGAADYDTFRLLADNRHIPKGDY